MSAAETTGKAFRAVHRYAPITARKARYVVDMIRGRPVNEALEKLQFCPRRGSPMVRRVLQAAVASASLDLEIDANRLFVADARADGGPTMKRGKARSRGQFFGILVRSSHIRVEVREAPEGGPPRRNGRPRRVRSGRKAPGAPRGGGAGAAGGEAAGSGPGKES
jgi:large subunit ribosomal protein L22